MTFRRIYWITEEFDDAGKSLATGVYTSVADLTEKGLRRIDPSSGKGFRLSLVKLDASEDVLGRWNSPDFAGLIDSIADYIKTGEMTELDREMLAEAVGTMANL